MKKVKLTLDDLTLDSFVTSPSAENDGAIRAQWTGKECGNNTTAMANGCGVSEGIGGGACPTGDCWGFQTNGCRFTWEMTCLPGTTTCCANESAVGYASCGTTCQDETYCGGGAPCGVTAGCNTGGGNATGGGATCEGTCDGTCTAPGAAC
jgi:hypothetical protein